MICPDNKALNKELQLSLSPVMIIKDQLSLASKGRTRPARDMPLWPEQFANDFGVGAWLWAQSS